MPLFHRFLPQLLAISLFVCTAPAIAEMIHVVDDTGQTVTLKAPARRIVTLAPSAVEIVYAAGAGDKIISTVDYSDYPPAATKIPRVGGYSNLDLEAIIASKPDLVIGWQSGNAPAAIDKLRQLNIPVFLTEPTRISDIANEVERIGTLAGTDKVARTIVRDFRKRYANLDKTYAKRSSVRLFYQISPSPLLTIGGTQIISDVIHTCGGENIFAALKPVAPRVSVEAVVAANPEAILTSGMQNISDDLLDQWKKWPGLLATQRNNFFFIDPDLINRSGPRILDGAQILCEKLQIARDRRIR